MNGVGGGGGVKKDQEVRDKLKIFYFLKKTILRSNLIKLHTYNSHQARVGRWNED